MHLFAVVAAVVTVATSQELNIHVVPHTHDDVGWLKTVDEYYTGANNTIQRAGVRYIITSVVEALAKDPSRKFIYVEQAFFQRWWREQNDETRGTVKRLVKNGQLSFVNGGWSMHDEACTHFIAMIDQTTLGHRLLLEEFGVTPTVGWQIDPFGHSATQAALLGADAGMDALFFGRIDYQDLKLRQNQSRCEWIWRGSPSLGPDAQVFTGLTGSYQGNYGPPGGFNFDVGSGDDPVENDPRLTTYNLPSRSSEFVAAARAQANMTRGSNVMFTMGSDFNYEAAEDWFMNLDRLIEGVNAQGNGVKAFYSTPDIYVAAKREEAASGKVQWPLTAGDDADLFPYADGPHQFWTGYFTSRPALKRYIRSNSAYFVAVRQAAAIAKGHSRADDLLGFEEALGVTQHHDSVTGTAKQHTTFDYAKRLSDGAAAATRVFSESLSRVLDAPGEKFGVCRRLNETVCSATQSAAPGARVYFSIWNSMAQPRDELVTFPVAFASGVTVRDESSGADVKVQVLPAQETITNYQRRTGESTFQASFIAGNLPAVGARTFSIQMPSNRSHQKSAPATEEKNSAVVLDNGILALNFSADGRLSHMVNKATGTVVSLTQDFCFYNSSRGDTLSGQKGGAYIFRPVTNTTCQPVVPANSPVKISYFPGDTVQEVRQSFGPWLVQIIRLAAGARSATFEFTVGPVPLKDPTRSAAEDACVGWNQTGDCSPTGPPDPHHDKNCSALIPPSASGFCTCAFGRHANPVGCGHPAFTCAEECIIQDGKNVVSRFTSSIASQGRMLTDSNGREMLHRRRNFRPSWNLTQTEQVAGNYFPINVAAAIRDDVAQLTVLTDASQGVGSIRDGEMELMVHRRLIYDDSRGVGEPLNETESVGSYAGQEGGMKWGPGLIIRGSHTVSLEPPATAARVWRPLADRVFAQPFVFFHEDGRENSVGASTVSALSDALPANVQIVTLQALEEPGKLLLRLSHQFGVGEDAELSQPTTVDLATLFSKSVFSVRAIREMSLTDNQSKDSIMKKRKAAAAWTAGRGDVPHPWRSLPPVNFDAGVADSSAEVTLGPLEIKTFQIAV